MIKIYKKCKEYDAFHFVKQKKEEGKIKIVGMSFHDMPELLDKILAEYGDCIDFLQLQINYVDMDQANVRGRECLEIAERYGKASDCIQCGKCEQACPQHLPIREYLEQVAGKFDNSGFFPTRAKD